MTNLPSFAAFDGLLAQGSEPDDRHGLLAFSVITIGVGTYFFTMGRRMLKEKPENRGVDLPFMAESWWEQHPRLSMAVGGFCIVVGASTLVLYPILLLFDIGGPAPRP